MANVEEAKTDYLKVKKSLASCQSSIAELQRKSDTLQESLPGLSREVENAEKAKTAALDAFALKADKNTESSLRIARTACEQVARQRIETNELIEATARALKKQEQELVRLNNLFELSKRECWQAVADEIHSRIPKGVTSDIQHLIVAETQCSKTKQFILNELLPNLNPSEYQAIRDKLSAQYEIDE